MAEYTGTDLKACVKLLTQLLQSDSKGRRFGLRKFPVRRLRRKSTAPIPVRYRKPNRATAQHRPHRCGASGYASTESLDKDIHELVLIRRQLMQAPTLNHEALIGLEEPEGDIPTLNESLEAPYNTRLPTSTPETSPHTKRKVEIVVCGGGIIKGVIGDHAMNSYEYLKDFQPERSKPATKLIQGHVDFQQNPYKAVGERSAFTRSHHNAMQEVYIDSLKASMPDPQYSLYSEDDLHLEKPCKDTNTTPARELRPPISPFKVNQTRKQTLGKLVKQSSLGAANQPNIQSHSLPATQQTNKTHVSQLSRAQLLQAALNVAMDAGALDDLPAFRKTGPISPFRPGLGTRGFSACDGGDGSQNEPQNEDSTLIGEPTVDQFQPNKAGVHADENVRYGYQDQTLRDSVADLHIPDQPVPRKVAKKTVPKTTRFDALAVPKKFTKNKKTQYGPKKQKQDDSSKVKQLTKISTKARSSSATQSVGIQANISKSSEIVKNKTHTGNHSNQTKIKSNKTVQKKSLTTDSQKSKSVFVVGVQAGTTEAADVHKSDECGRSENNVLREKSLTNVDNNRQNVEANKENHVSDVKLHKSHINEKRSSATIEIVEVSDNMAPDYKVEVLDQAKYSGLFVQIKHLAKELRAVPGIKLDKEGKRLLKELDEKVNKSQLDLQTDLDMAVQPLRSENAQLRRRVQILAQQLKDKEHELQEAENPDPNFMVVHLQMQNYNLDNELKSQKQLISKLKDEVQVYKTELEKVNVDRTELINLVGKADKGALAPQIIAENKTLKTQIDAYKQTNADLEKNTEELDVQLRRMNIDCRQKDQELNNMQELVKTLQASMKHLLHEMQFESRDTGTSPERLSTIREAPTDYRHSAASRLSQRTHGLPPAQIDLPQTHTDVAPVPNPAAPDTRFSALPDNTNTRLEQARVPVGEATISQNDVQARSEFVRVQSHSPENKLPSLSGIADSRTRHEHDGHRASHVRRSNEDPHLATVPETHSRERIGMFFMDQPGLNYSKIAESLNDAARQRISLSTNPDTDITEYRQYPGTSPMQLSAFDKLDPFVKDLLKSQRIRNQEVQHQGAHFKSPSKSPPSIHSVATVTTSVATATESETKESTSTGPTVKDLLTPLAERMARFQSHSDTEKSRAVRAINFDAPPPAYQKPEVPALALPRGHSLDSDDSYTLRIQKGLENIQYEDSSSTLMTETTEEQMTPKQNLTEADSRYSVTDYFHKYPDATTKKNKLASKMTNRDEEENDADISEDYRVADVIDGWGELQRSHDQNLKMIDSAKNKMVGRWAEQVVFSPGGVPVIFDNNSRRSSPQVSPQDNLYRGTDLDTSISTINDRESIVTSNSVTTTDSLSSVDDRIFRQGLANLDANIERVQKSLRDAMI